MLRQGQYLLKEGRIDGALVLFRKAVQILRRPGVVGAPPEDIFPGRWCSLEFTEHLRWAPINSGRRRQDLGDCYALVQKLHSNSA